MPYPIAIIDLEEGARIPVNSVGEDEGAGIGDEVGSEFVTRGATSSPPAQEAGMKNGWEDFPVGRTATTPSVTVTESHLVWFAGLTGDMYPAHTDAEWAAQSPFGQRIAHGPLTFALAVGCMYQSQFYGDAILAWLGADKIRATAPVFIGDAVHVVATVTGSRPAKDPSRGVVSLDYAVRNQRDEDVMFLSLTMLMRSREQ